MREAITVSKLNRYIKDMFTQNQMLYNIMVKGEISNFKESHGNYYFSLKDETSTIQAIIFNNYAYNCNVSNIKDGMSVVVTGKVAVYDKAGTYAIYVSKLSEEGLGEYYVRLNLLKEKLSKEGLFDEAHKKEVPLYAMNIGVVTAETGAAIRDIIKTLKNKNPYVRIVLYPSIVQGDRAASSIVDGIEILDKENLDVIIIGRGGGSIEDLYAFNDESVAYAIYDAKTPIISAVGHEINESISDLVADLHVATPTAAGEKATFSYDEFIESIESYQINLREILNKKLDILKERLDSKMTQLELLSPRQKIKNYRETYQYKKEKINDLINIKLETTKQRFISYIEMLKGRDVLSRLEKGYAYVTDEKDKKIISIKKIKIGTKVKMRLKDGNLITKVEKVI